MITQAELKELLHYNPISGDFEWKKSGSGRKQGVAGCLDTYNGYIRLAVRGTMYLAHRLAWLYIYGVWPKEIDHINHIRDDNRIINLREVTRRENQRNRGMSRKNTSGVAGVSLIKASNKWQATINNGTKNISLGCYADKFEAICARKSANNKYNFHPNHGAKK